MIAETSRITRFSRPEAETCEYIGPEGVYWSRGPVILHSETLSGPVTPVAHIPRPMVRAVLASTRLGRRLARETVYIILPMGDGSLFFSYGTQQGIIRDGQVTFLLGMVQGSRILRDGCARLPDGSIIFGEYFNNADREVVRVYRIAIGATQVEEVFQFAPGEIRHIHAVNWDPVANRVVVTAGDIDDECRIVTFLPDFKDCQTLGRGSEKWRTIGLQFSTSSIYFGTDAQFTPNFLYRYDRATGELATLAEVNGPVFYSAAVPDGWLFATTAELCPSQTSPEAILYHIDASSETVCIVARFEKDCLSTRYFQFGILNLPIMDSPQPRVPVSGVGLRGLDAKFVVVRNG